MAKILARRHKPRWRHSGSRSGVAHMKKRMWLTKDRGRKGKTRLKARWSRKVHVPPQHKIVGYTTSAPLSKRLAALRKEVRQRGGGRKGVISTARTLQMITNLNPSRKSDRVMKKDIKRIAPTWGKK